MNRFEWRRALRESRVDATAKLVAFVLDTYADRDGYCFPGRPTIAAGASCDVRTVDQAVRRLESRGFVRVKRSRGRVKNEYWLIAPNSEPASPFSPSTANENRGNGEPESTVTANLLRANSEGGSPEVVSSKTPLNGPENLPDDLIAQVEDEDARRELPEAAREFLERLRKGDPGAALTRDIA